VNISPNCTAVVEHFESCRLKAYPDPKTGGAPWTVGWGATGPGINADTVWTQAEADTRLARDLVFREAEANQAIRAPLTQGQFDGFVSILFNVGHGSPIKDGIIRLRSGLPSTLLRKLNERDYDGAREQFILWVSPGTNVEHGLRRRRVTEQQLWDGLDAHSAIVIGEAA
jgi:lysozyme